MLMDYELTPFLSNCLSPLFVKGERAVASNGELLSDSFRNLGFFNAAVRTTQVEANDSRIEELKQNPSLSYNARARMIMTHSRLSARRLSIRF